MKIPIWIAYDSFVDIKGEICIMSSDIRPAMIRIGFKYPNACESQQTRLIIRKKGVLVFKGEAHIGKGSKLIINENACLSLGDNFAISANSTINCYKKIIFGRDIQFSWDCLVMDSDTHMIYDENSRIVNNPRDIIIGDKVWIGCKCIILKGSVIPDNCVIGACSLLAGKYTDGNSTILGNPAMIKKKIGGWNL